MAQDKIPTIDEYRGVAIHDFQTQERIDTVVKPEIDIVHEMDDPQQLFEYCSNPYNSPEARLFAAAKARAAHAIAAEARIGRPAIDLALVDATIAGLNTLTWSAPGGYTCVADACKFPPGSPPPPSRPPEIQEAFIRAEDEFRARDRRERTGRRRG